MTSTSAILRHRRDTAANWNSTNPVLEAGQVGHETDTRKSKLGDGSTAWNSLSYTEGVNDGDKGDVDVSGSGSVWKVQSIAESLAILGDLSPSQITADQNDYNPTNLATSTILRLSTDQSRYLTGLAGGADGRIITILNVGSNGLCLAHEDSGSSAANRFILPASESLPIGASGSVTLIYDATSSRWRIMAYYPGAIDAFVTEISTDLLTANRSTGLSADGWYQQWAGTGSQLLAIEPTSTFGLNRVGLVQFETGTTATGASSISGGQGSAAAFCMTLGQGEAIFDCELYTDASLSDATNRYYISAGFADAYSISPTNGLIFQYEDDLNAGKWRVWAQDGGAGGGATDTGVTVAVSTWYRLRLVVNAAGTAAKCYINGSLVATISSEIPVVSGQAVIPIVSMTKTAGTTERVITVDRARCRQILTVAKGAFA